MTTAANWFFNWLLSFITPYLLDGLEPIQSNVFWIWGSFCWIAVVFVFFLVRLFFHEICSEELLLTSNVSRYTKRRTFRSNKSTSCTKTRARLGDRPSTALPSEDSLLSTKVALAPALTMTRRRDDRSPSRTSPSGNIVPGGFQRLKDMYICNRAIPNKHSSISNCLWLLLKEIALPFASTSALCSITDIL